MTRSALIKLSVALVIIIGLTAGGLSLTTKKEQNSIDPRVQSAIQAGIYLQERLEVIARINDHKFAIEELKKRETELQTLENEAKSRSIENASGYNYLETAF